MHVKEGMRGIEVMGSATLHEIHACHSPRTRWAIASITSIPSLLAGAVTPERWLL